MIVRPHAVSGYRIAGSLLSTVVITGLCGGIASPARADLTLIDVYNNASYFQTTGAAPTSPLGYFFDVGGLTQNAGDFDTISAAYPGPASPRSLAISNSSFNFGTPIQPLAAIHAAYPFGAYTFSAINSVTSASQTAALQYTGDNFTTAVPALTPGTVSALNGLDPSRALTVQFNSFTPNPAATEGFTFFTLYDGTTGAVVFSNGFLAPSTTSVVVPANTLTANKSYNFELDFSDRLNGFDPVSGVGTAVGSDVRTDGAFTTGAVAAPEPGSIALLASAMLVLRGVRRRG